MPAPLKLAALAAVALSAAACTPGSGVPDPESGGFRPIDPEAAVFWDRQTTANAELLRAIVSDYNAANAGMDIRLVHGGNYSDIYTRVVAGIRAGSLPALAVAYETMIIEFARAGAVVPLDDFIAEDGPGLLDDFFPALIETNTFDELGGKMYSFPYTKSVLLLYYNRRVLAEAGLHGPPATWGEFLAQCRQIKRETGKRAWAIDVDPSTVVGMIYSAGGDLLDGAVTRFDASESVAIFELMETLVKEDLAYQNPPRTYNDQTAFGANEIAFNIRPSSSIPYIADLIGDDAAWGVAPLPQAIPADPRTILFGANICIFRTNPVQERAAWDFVKYFTSPEVSTRWALGTGYLPLRRSAVNQPEIQAFWDAVPNNRIAFESLAFARPEPNVGGWQVVRDAIATAQTAVLTRMKTGRQAALDLKSEADALLAAR